MALRVLVYKLSWFFYSVSVSRKGTCRVLSNHPHFLCLKIFLAEKGITSNQGAVAAASSSIDVFLEVRSDIRAHARPACWTKQEFALSLVTTNHRHGVIVDGVRS